jgi:hypothetical protein
MEHFRQTSTCPSSMMIHRIQVAVSVTFIVQRLRVRGPGRHSLQHVASQKQIWCQLARFDRRGLSIGCHMEKMRTEAQWIKLRNHHVISRTFPCRPRRTNARLRWTQNCAPVTHINETEQTSLRVNGRDNHCDCCCCWAGPSFCGSFNC